MADKQANIRKMHFRRDLRRLSYEAQALLAALEELLSKHTGRVDSEQLDKVSMAIKSQKETADKIDRIRGGR